MVNGSRFLCFSFVSSPLVILILLLLPCIVEDGTFLCPLNKRTMAERSFTRAHEPEFKKQKLEQLQRKAYHSVLLASKSEPSGTSHVTLSHSSSSSLIPFCSRSYSALSILLLVQNKSQLIIQKLMNEWNIGQETHISVSEKIDHSVSI